MKTIVLRVPEPAHEAAVLAALTELLNQKMIEFDSELPLGWPGQALSVEGYGSKLAQALAAPRMSAEEAQKRLGLCLAMDVQCCWAMNSYASWS